MGPIAYLVHEMQRISYNLIETLYLVEIYAWLWLLLVTTLKGGPLRVVHTSAHTGCMLGNHY